MEKTFMNGLTKTTNSFSRYIIPLSHRVKVCQEYSAENFFLCGKKLHLFCNLKKLVNLTWIKQKQGDYILELQRATLYSEIQMGHVTNWF